MTIEIAPATSDDAEQILEVQKLAYRSEAQLYGDWSIPPLTQTVDELRLDFAEWRYLKASENDRIIGAARARSTRGICEIGRLCVHPDAQKRGIGTRLLKAAEQVFPNARQYELFTGKSSFANIRLYERLGYAITGTERLSLQVELVFMHKPAEAATASTATLRRATTADAAAIRDLTRAAYAKWVPLIGREPLPMQADYVRAVDEHLIDLVEVDGKLVALVEMIPAADHLLIENLAVHPEAQSRGLGAQLLAHAEVVACDLRVAEVRLYTNEKFAANIAFYTKRGYEIYERGSLVPGSITVFMRKTIKPTQS